MSTPLRILLVLLLSAAFGAVYAYLDVWYNIKTPVWVDALTAGFIVLLVGMLP